MRLYANGLTTRITAGIASGATSVAVTTGEGANWAAANGTDHYVAVLREMSGAKQTAFEIVNVTNRSTDTLTIARAKESTTARAFSEGAILDVDVTAASLNTISARVYHNAAQSIADVTLTALALNSERYDTATIHDTVTNNSRLTAPSAGLYRIHGQVEYAAGTGFRVVQIRLNGATKLAAIQLPAVSGSVHEMEISTIYQLAAADYVELMVYQNSGGALNVNSAANYSPEFMMQRVGE